MRVNTTTIETGMWAIQRYLMKKYGASAASRDIEPLNWYINTGRASVPFISAVLDSKPFIIGRILHKGGSYDETVQRVKDYLGVGES